LQASTGEPSGFLALGQESHAGSDQDLQGILEALDILGVASDFIIPSITSRTQSVKYKTGKIFKYFKFL
jgi:hypothetical protein